MMKKMKKKTNKTYRTFSMLVTLYLAYKSNVSDLLVKRLWTNALTTML